VSSSFRYRYACDTCQAISYDEITICRRCGSLRIRRKTNGPKRIQELQSGERPARSWEPGSIEREHPNKESTDKATGKAAPKIPDDLDELARQVLDG